MEAVHYAGDDAHVPALAQDVTRPSTDCIAQLLDLC